MPLCCAAPDYAPCYASVLVAGHDLRSAVEALETEHRICPCVTVWCSACKRVTVDVTEAGEFPCPSAHLAHALAVRRMVEETLESSDLRE